VAKKRSKRNRKARPSPPDTDPDPAYAGDFRRLAESFGSLLPAILQLPERDAGREFLSLAAQGGKLLCACGIAHAPLWYPDKRPDGSHTARRIDPAPGSPPTVALGDTQLRNDDYHARVWAGFVNEVAHLEPASFPDPTGGWTNAGDGTAFRLVRPEDDPRPQLRMECRVSQIAAQLTAERLLQSPSHKPAATNATERPTKRKNRRRSDEERAADEAKILVLLDKQPDILRDELAKLVGISGGLLSSSKSWKRHQALRRDAKRKARARALGKSDHGSDAIDGASDTVD
jgi:hypothetical protein